MTYKEWLNQTRDELVVLLRNDQEEALYQAWFAGYKAGMDKMVEFTETSAVGKPE